MAKRKRTQGQKAIWGELGCPFFKCGTHRVTLVKSLLISHCDYDRRNISLVICGTDDRRNISLVICGTDDRRNISLVICGTDIPYWLTRS
jgi:hypothetical protein